MLTKEGVKRVEVGLNKDYTCAIVLKQFYKGEHIGDVELPYCFIAGDSIDLTINGLKVEYDGCVLVNKKWWEFWK